MVDADSVVDTSMDSLCARQIVLPSMSSFPSWHLHLTSHVRRALRIHPSLEVLDKVQWRQGAVCMAICTVEYSAFRPSKQPPIGSRSESASVKECRLFSNAAGD